MDAFWRSWIWIGVIYFGFWILYSWLVNCIHCLKTRYVLLSFPVTLVIRVGIWALLAMTVGAFQSIIALVIFTLIEMILVFTFGWYGLFGWYEYSIYYQHCLDWYHEKCSGGKKSKSDDDCSSESSKSSASSSCTDSSDSSKSSKSSSSDCSSSDDSRHDRKRRDSYCLPDLDRYYRKCDGFWYCRSRCGPSVWDIGFLFTIVVVSLAAIALGAGLFPYFQLESPMAYSLERNSGIWFWFWAGLVAFIAYLAIIHLISRVVEPCHRWIWLNYRTWIVILAVYFMFVGIWSGAPWYYGLIFVILWIVIDHWVVCSPCVGYGRDRNYAGCEAFFWLFVLFLLGTYVLRDYTMLPINPEAVAIHNPGYFQAIQGLIFATSPNTAVVAVNSS